MSEVRRPSHVPCARPPPRATSSACAEPTWESGSPAPGSSPPRPDHCPGRVIRRPARRNRGLRRGHDDEPATDRRARDRSRRSGGPMRRGRHLVRGRCPGSGAGSSSSRGYSDRPRSTGRRAPSGARRRWPTAALAMDAGPGRNPDREVRRRRWCVDGSFDEIARRSSMRSTGSAYVLATVRDLAAGSGHAFTGPAAAAMNVSPDGLDLSLVVRPPPRLAAPT